MPGKIETYRRQIRETSDIDSFLKRHSGLPGPRGNLELAHAFVHEAEASLIRRYAGFEPEEAPENTPEAFLAFCGVFGLGRLILEGDLRAEGRLKARAADPRWRVREAAAMAVQMVGDADSGGYDRLVAKLAAGNPLEQRAAVAAVAEPRLLASAEAVRRGLRILDKTTRSLTQLPKPLDEKARVLRQALGYAWSVLVVANPGLGKPAMEAWLRSSDVDVRWLMAQNLAKKRLLRLDSAWCAEWSRRLRSKSQTGSSRSSASKARRERRSM